MREIRFRAWNIEDRIMHNIAFPTWNGCYEVWSDNKPGTTTEFLTNGEERECVLMQYTGHKAKYDNRDVYESDICEATFKTKDSIVNVTGVIIFDEYMWCLKCTEETYSLNRVTIINIIGNIYQNPTPQPG